MPQTQDTTPHPVTVYRHGANLSLCYPSMWNVTLEYTATHFNVLGETRPGNPSPTFHTHQRTFNLMLSWWSTVGSSVESTFLLESGTPFCFLNVSFQEGWPLVRGRNNTSMLRFTLSYGFSRVDGLSSGWPLKRGYTVFCCQLHIVLYFYRLLFSSWHCGKLVFSNLLKPITDKLHPLKLKHMIDKTTCEVTWFSVNQMI